MTFSGTVKTGGAIMCRATSSTYKEIIMTDNLTLRDQIVNALCDGFGHSVIKNVVRTGDYTDVFIDGYDEPIRVLPLDVLVPDEYEREIVAGIHLDVRAIIADNDQR